VLDEAIRSSVRLEQRNLVAEDPELWQPEAYDVIFCRNVIMYFTPAGAQAAIAGITRALAPGGYLFLGHAETLRGLSSDFHLRHTHGAFYYQRKERIEPAGFPVTIAAELRAVPHGGGPVAAVEGAETWVDAIRKAAARIQALTAAPERPPSQAPVPQPADSHWELGLALDLLRRERFSEALEVLRALPPGSGHDPDVLLLHAVLLTHGGQLARAEEECRRLLEVDELNAGAHYLLALTREGAGDRRAAAEHDQTAAYLDSGFAMPRLHLGLLARRAGEAETARRELEQALALLQREDPSRLLLFGGGFSREALVGLCRTELLACGGRP
jgi:chemotaxis protein methyltransferase CheR